MFSSSSRQRNTKFCASSSFTNLRGEIRRREKGIRIVLGDLSFEPLVDFQLVSFFRESVNRLAKELLKVRYISNRTSIPFTYQFNDQNAKCVDISLIGEIPSLYNFRRAISPRSTWFWLIELRWLVDDQWTSWNNVPSVRKPGWSLPSTLFRPCRPHCRISHPRGTTLYRACSPVLRARIFRFCGLRRRFLSR